MESGFSLIDAAAEKMGSRYKLAMKLGESQSFLSQVEHGKKRMPPSLAARLAVIAGVDARRAAMDALVSQEKDHEKAVALALALGVDIPAEPPPRNGVTVQLA
jgi:transcriptional regulator with XRE-family HTH domain